MGDLAQRAVPSAESGTDPVGEFTAQGAVGVGVVGEIHIAENGPAGRAPERVSRLNALGLLGEL